MASARTFATTTFRSFHVRNYKLFFLGQGTSLVGTWMQTIALGWLVLDLTGSGVAIGTVIAVQFLPALLVGPYGGVLADRFDKRSVLFITQAGQALFATLLGIVVVADVAQLWIVYWLLFR